MRAVVPHFMRAVVPHCMRDVPRFYALRMYRLENPVLWARYQMEREAIRAQLPRKGAFFHS